MAKKRTIEELRQTKDSVYTHPTTHTDYEFITHRFTGNKLIEYIKECISKVNGVVDEIDEKIIEDFVKNNKEV
tara:strand:+ start:204 stop:422 length:219 start_codon:yes stop_codon:yes gene_type:complete